MNVKYYFTVRGVYTNGIKAKMSGRIVAEDGYPMSAFEAAIKTSQDIYPGLNVDLENVRLRKLKS